jgi:hypothetical protein
VAAAVADAPMAGASTDALLDSLGAEPAPSAGFPEMGIEELSMSRGTDVEEIELEELPPESSLETIEEEIVDEDELGPAPTFGALDEEPSAPDLSVDRGGVLSTAPVSVELSATSGPTDIAIPVDVNLRNGAARVQLHIRLTLNLNLQR